MSKSAIGRRLIIGLIHFYQGWKWTGLVPASCRFLPSCSDYTTQAIEKCGIFQGIRLGLARIARCRPGCPGGFDPVH